MRRAGLPGSASSRIVPRIIHVPYDSLLYERTAPAYEIINRARRKDYDDEARQIVSLVRRFVPHARSLLDVACGTGTHLAHLAKQFEVVRGIELSGAMIEEARRRHPQIEVHQGDMRTFRLDRAFDAVVCLFSSIGYMTTVEDLDLAVSTMAKHLAAPGVLIIEGWLTPERWKGGTVFADCGSEEGIAVARVTRTRTNGAISTLTMDWLIASRERIDRVTEEHTLRLFTTEEYRSAITAARLDYRKEDGLTGRGLHVGLRPAIPDREVSPRR
jgi:SAM-dependent methyltransferase